MRAARWGLALATLGGVVAVGLALASSPGAASGVSDPCAAPGTVPIGKVFGPTTSQAPAVIDGRAGCRTTLSSGLAIDQLVRTGGAAELERLRATHPPGSTEVIDGYADGAFFGWGVGDALELAVRRGDQVHLLRLTGQDAASGFSADDPEASAPDGAVSGSSAGSGIWILMGQWLADSGPGADRPSTDDLSGRWRTNDIEGCAPAGALTARVSDVTQSGDRLSATKISGDRCLTDRDVDFRGSVSGLVGEGSAFGTIAGTNAGSQGADFRLVIVSPVDLQLVGQVGNLQYTREYQRISWPALDAPTHEESSLLGLPAPTEALTARNAALTTVLWVVLLLLVVLPTSLFNSTLAEHLEEIRGTVARWRGRVGWLAPRSTSTRSLWTRTGGVVLYLAAAGLLFSFMQPGWGLNTATITTLIGFLGGAMVTTGAGVGAAVWHDRAGKEQLEGHLAVVPSTLGVAAFFVLASRLVGFVPGYLYGVIVGWEVGRERPLPERGRIVALASGLRLVLAVAAWVAIGGIRFLSGPDEPLVASLVEALLAGIFVAAIHELMIGLAPLQFLPGRALQTWNRLAWVVLWAAGGWLFVLVLLRPGLASAESHNVVGTIVLATIASGLAVAFWRHYRRSSTMRDQALATPPTGT